MPMLTDKENEAAWRAKLEAEHGQVWDTNQLRDEFNVIGFAAPLVAVKRKADGVEGTLEFVHMPRFYFDFQSGE